MTKNSTKPNAINRTTNICFTRGARQTERTLIEALQPWLLGTPRGLFDHDPPDLTHPVRIVVSSSSQRDHLAARLVETFGHALLGVRIQTHFHLALEIWERSNQPLPRGTLLLDFLIRRFAAQERPLFQILDELEEGYGAVLGSVRDFLDAGFETVHFEAIDDLLKTEGQSRGGRHQAEIGRIRSLLKVALTTRLTLDQFDFAHRSTILRRARDLLDQDPSAIPCRALFIHGFADATGVVTDLLEALLRHFPGSFFLDQPPDPALPERLESAYTMRITSRLKGFPTRSRADAASRAEIELMSAPDPESEILELSGRIARLIHEGTPPEQIAVVARDLDPYSLMIRQCFLKTGVPFSARGAKAPLQPEQRQHLFLLDLLKEGVRLPIERWLSHRKPSFHRKPLSQSEQSQDELLQDVLSQGELLQEVQPQDERHRIFSAQGLGRLGDLLDFEPESQIQIEPANGLFQAAQNLAHELEHWAELEQIRPLNEHIQRLETLVDDLLAWPASSKARVSLASVLDSISRDLPVDWPMRIEEFNSLLAQNLKGAAAAPLGGEGGGVQVLDALESRSLTFRHLFLIGLHRDLFPRPIHEDPLLSDAMRTQIGRLLPDLPIKATGFDEERYLFAQLLSSSPRITLSWPRRDSFGKTLAVSPLLERWREHSGVAVTLVPDCSVSNVRRPIQDRIQRLGMQSPRDLWATALPLATSETIEQLPTLAGSTLTSQTLARGRRAVIEELDPDLTTRLGRARSRRLGPYFGLVGKIRRAEDPRQRDLFVTTLENLAACPWQTFLSRLLRLRPPQDVLDSLPRLRGRILGQLVHQTLETLARRALSMPYSGPNSKVAEESWPDEKALDGMLYEQSKHLLLENGLRLDGLARAAARLARPYLDLAKRLDWTPNPPPVRAVEARGSCQVLQGQKLRTIRFQADRVDNLRGGRLHTDYKTGGLPGAGSRQALLANVASGRWLQLAAYVYGSPQLHEAERQNLGRYLFLRPDLPSDQRHVEARADDVELRRVFEESARKLLDLWDEGSFFPRLLQPQEDLEPRLCTHCELQEACLRRDSGSRARLRRWSEGAHGPKDRASKAVWDLE